MKRGDALGLALAALVAVTSATAAGCKGRAPSSSSRSTEGADHDRHTGPALAVLDVTGGLPERSSPGLFSLASHRTFDELLRVIDKVREDKETKGALVRFGGISIGSARADELGEALGKLRAEKPVFCQADGYTNQTLYVAARGCTKTFVSPAGEVDAIGIAAQVVYMRRLLADELHLAIDFEQIGKFKGAEEPLTRDGPSPEARESLESVLADIRESWLDGIHTGRPSLARAPEGTNALDPVEDGPYSPELARQRGLVDAVGYYDDARDEARKVTGAVRDDKRFGAGVDPDKPDDLGDFLRAVGGDSGENAPVALVKATGSISMSGGGGLLGGSGGITEKELGRTIAKLERDDDVKAVVLRIDSPGGSALASDLLWHALMKLRAKKPLVVSVGDMAASGGYYLSSTANAIFADASSIVGSIGVVGGKVAAADALQRIGVHAETFPAKRGDARAANRAAYESIVDPWDDETRARVVEGMTAVYDLFLRRVAEGRGIPVAKVAASAEGRIFSGRQGKARGLVDEIGGLQAAIAKAKELAKLEPSARVGVVEAKPALLDALGGPSDEPGESSGSGEDDGARGGAAASASSAAASVAAAMGPQRPLDWLAAAAPDVAPFAQALAPLAAHEHRVLAVPFAFVVR